VHIVFGGSGFPTASNTNVMRNTSQSSSDAVGMAGWVFLDTNKAASPFPAYPPSQSDYNTLLQKYAFANSKALTALVQIDNGVFTYAEWNWDQVRDSRATRHASHAHALNATAIAAGHAVPEQQAVWSSPAVHRCHQPLRLLHQQPLHQQSHMRRACPRPRRHRCFSSQLQMLWASCCGCR